VLKDSSDVKIVADRHRQTCTRGWILQKGYQADHLVLVQLRRPLVGLRSHRKDGEGTALIITGGIEGKKNCPGHELSQGAQLMWPASPTWLRRLPSLASSKEKMCKNRGRVKGNTNELLRSQKSVHHLSLEPLTVSQRDSDITLGGPHVQGVG